MPTPTLAQPPDASPGTIASSAPSAHGAAVAWQRALPLYAVLFLAQFGTGVLSPLLPDLKQEFALTYAQLGLVSACFGLARLLMDLPAGALADRIPVSRLLSFGTLCVVAGTALTGLAPAYPFLLAGRLLNGLGSGVLNLTVLVTLTRAAGASHRGRVVGTVSATLQAGTTISPLIGGVLATLTGWRWALLACAASSALAFATVRLRLSGSQGDAETRRRGDTATRGHGDPLPQHSALRTPHSALRFWEPALLVVNFATFALLFSFSGFRGQVGPLYGAEVLGLSASAIGLAMSVGAGLRFPITLFSGALSDRIGRKVVLLPGMLCLAASALLLNTARDVTGFYASILLFALGGFGNTVTSTLLADRVPPARLGAVMGGNRFLGDLGLVLGPLVVGTLLDLGRRSGNPSAAAATAFLPATVATAAVLLVAAALVAAAVREVDRGH